MQGFSNPYIALIGQNPFRACLCSAIDGFNLKPSMALHKKEESVYLRKKKLCSPQEVH